MKYIDYPENLTRENYYWLHRALRATRAAEPHDVVVRLRKRATGRDFAFIRCSKKFGGVSCFTMTCVENYIHYCRIIYQRSDTQAEKDKMLNDARGWAKQYGY